MNYVWNLIEILFNNNANWEIFYPFFGGKKMTPQITKRYAN